MIVSVTSYRIEFDGAIFTLRKGFQVLLVFSNCYVSLKIAIFFPKELKNIKYFLHKNDISKNREEVLKIVKGLNTGQAEHDRMWVFIECKKDLFYTIYNPLAYRKNLLFRYSRFVFLLLFDGTHQVLVTMF